MERRRRSPVGAGADAFRRRRVVADRRGARRRRGGGDRSSVARLGLPGGHFHSWTGERGPASSASDAPDRPATSQSRPGPVRCGRTRTAARAPGRAAVPRRRRRHAQPPARSPRWEPDWGGFVLRPLEFRQRPRRSRAPAAAIRLASSVAAGGHCSPVAATQEGGRRRRSGPATRSPNPRSARPGSRAVARSAGAARRQAAARARGQHDARAAGRRRHSGRPAQRAPVQHRPGRRRAASALRPCAGYAAAGVISAVGHFPGTGGASADPDQMTATVGGSLARCAPTT